MSNETSSNGGKVLYCSFCGKSEHEVRKLIAGPSVYICDECVELCNDIIREELQAKPANKGLPKPQEIKSVLDDYVIGQGSAACEQTATMADEARQALTTTLKDMNIIDDCAREVAGATEQQSALAAQVERQAEHLLHLGNQSVQSSESARQESEQLGSNVDQAQLLTSHFLQMLCDKLLNKGAQASTRQFPEPAQ